VETPRRCSVSLFISASGAGVNRDGANGNRMTGNEDRPKYAVSKANRRLRADATRFRTTAKQVTQ
jgi:hypothetical protein